MSIYEAIRRVKAGENPDLLVPEIVFGLDDETEVSDEEAEDDD